MPKCLSHHLGLPTLGIFAVLLVFDAAAAPIELVPGTVNMFRDSRGANNVGIGQGERLQFGANIVGGSGGTTVGASYPPSGFIASQALCNPLAVNANFCATATAFNAGRIAEPWLLRFERANEAPVLIGGPSLTGTADSGPVPGQRHDFGLRLDPDHCLDDTGCFSGRRSPGEHIRQRDRPSKRHGRRHSYGPGGCERSFLHDSGNIVVSSAIGVRRQLCL